jgi:predicted nucleotidyltransferase
LPIFKLISFTIFGVIVQCYTLRFDGDTNKIDLPAADPERVVDEIEDVIGVEAQDAVYASAKSGVTPCEASTMSSAPSQADSERETS